MKFIITFIACLCFIAGSLMMIGCDDKIRTDVLNKIRIKNKSELTEEQITKIDDLRNKGYLRGGILLIIGISLFVAKIFGF